MQRRSRRPFSASVGKSRASKSFERTQYSPGRRLDYLSPVERRQFVDEGNNALMALVALNVRYQQEARLSAGRSASKGARRPRASPVAARPAAVPGRRVFALRSSVFPTYSKISDALVCARRHVRRELVFASGAGGSRRIVKQRASPSPVRC